MGSAIHAFCGRRKHLPEQSGPTDASYYLDEMAGRARGMGELDLYFMEISIGPEGSGEVRF